MFRSLLLRRECCSFSNGEYVKAGLHELEQWCVKATDQVTGLSKCEFLQYKECQVQDDKKKNYIPQLSCIQFSGSSWDELQHIRQAVGFLVRSSEPNSIRC